MILHDSEKTPVLGEVGINKLTPRQIEIIGIVAQGKSEKQTSRILSISRNTVHKHITNAQAKLRLNRIQLIVAFAQWQVTEGKEQ